MLARHFVALITALATLSACGQTASDQVRPITISSTVSLAKTVEAVREDLVFESRGVKLAATIVRPEGDGPFPAIALTHGSAKEGRWLRGYQFLAEFFAAQGFACLIWDKRGTGESEGDYIEQPMMEVPADDLLAGVHVLQNIEYVDGDRVGVWGHSQGGWTVALAAAKSDDIAFVVSSCGGGMAIYEQVAYARSVAYKERTGSSEGMKEAELFGRELFRYMGTGEGYAELKPKYEAATKEKWFMVFREWGFTDAVPSPDKLKLAADQFMFRASFDPASSEEAIKVPTLAIFGTGDPSTNTEAAADRWKQHFETSGNTDPTVTVIEGMGHAPWWMKDGEIVMHDEYRAVLTKWLGRFASAD